MGEVHRSVFFIGTSCITFKQHNEAPEGIVLVVMFHG